MRFVLTASIFFLLFTCAHGSAAADAADAPLLAPSPSSPAPPTRAVNPSIEDEQQLPPPPPPVPPPSARKDEDADEIPRPLLALAAGAGLTTASFATGTLIISRTSDRHVRNGAMLGAQTGMSFAPLIAHMIVGETKRGLLFAAIPFAAEVSMATFMAFVPNLITLSPLGVQYAYATLIAASIFGATLGTLDAVRVGERKPSRHRAASTTTTTTTTTSTTPPKAAATPTLRTGIYPMLGDGFAGAAIYGSL